MAAQPLTHHEILGLVEPFTRRGRHVDLAASDRLARRLDFKPLDHLATAPTAPTLRETLRLDNPAEGRFQLQRIVSAGDGLESRLVADGSNPAELLARIEAVPIARQLDAPHGVTIARSHRAERSAASGNTAPRLVFLRGMAVVDGLRVSIEGPSVRGSPAGIEVVDPQVQRLDLPEDLLGVLGWHWSRLEATNIGWRSSLRLRGAKRDERAQGEDAERQFERLVAHLAQCLAEPPARFHERHVAARWRFAARRAMPLAISLGLIGAAFAVSKLQVAQDSVWRLMILQAPPLLLVLVFSLREIPRIEIPPLPRRSAAPAWRATPRP